MDEVELEIMLAHKLDDLGAELQAASKRLRSVPYAAIQSFIHDAQQTLNYINYAGEAVMKGDLRTAYGFLSEIDMPEIVFADEEAHDTES